MELCFKGAYFKQNGILYKQEHGTPMGSPVSVVLAELTLQALEKKMFSEAPSQPLLWKRYLDDVIAMLPKNQIENHLHYINTLNPHLKFTVEREENKRLPFLDLLI